MNGDRLSRHRGYTLATWLNGAERAAITRCIG